MSYIVWRQHDADLNLWLPTDCATFDQAAAAWLEVVQSGGHAEIMERVPVTIVRDARTKESPPPRRTKRGATGFNSGSRAESIAILLQTAPDGLSRTQLAAATGFAKTDIGSSVAGLMKVGRVRTEQRPATEERGTPAVGRTTVAVYFWND